MPLDLPQDISEDDWDAVYADSQIREAIRYMVEKKLTVGPDSTGYTCFDAETGETYVDGAGDPITAILLTKQVLGD